MAQRNNHSMKNRVNNSNNFKKKNNRNTSNIDEIFDSIEKLDKLSDLKPEIYADVGGYADRIAKEFSRLNTNQLRKFFGAVRNIEKNKTWDEIQPELYLLKPKLAVAVGRKLIPRKFYEFMNITMNKIDVGENSEEKLENFDTFVKFLEAIVAYHKYYN